MSVKILLKNYIGYRLSHGLRLLLPSMPGMKRVLSAGDVTGNNDGFTKVQRKKSKKAAASSQPVRNENSVVDTDDDLSQLQRTVHAQQATINSLTRKLKFVLSFLDIPDSDSTVDDLGPVTS